MPKVQERGVPHSTFTDHWIRVVRPESTRLTAQRSDGRPIEPYFEQDKTGPDADVYQGMGEIVCATLANNGRVLGNAAAALDRALGKDTTRGEAHFLLGVAFSQLGRTDDAIRALEQSVRSNSDQPDCLRALAQAYERAGRTPAAIDSLYERALSLQPASSWIRADHADFLQASGRRDKAKTAYSSCTRRAAEPRDGLVQSGDVLAEDGGLEGAAVSSGLAISAIGGSLTSTTSERSQVEAPCRASRAP